MAEIIKSKTLNTILRLKYDTLANWKAAEEYVPMKGEVCIVAVPADTQQVASEPAILFKVGDGAGVVFKKEGSSKTELPWASGLAADVYSWAKAKDKPTYKAEEITVTDTTLLKSANVEGALSEIWNKIASITGEEPGTGTIAQQIAQGIADLGSATVTDGNYVTGVKVENGKLVLTETPLPDYSNTYAAKSLEKTVSDVKATAEAAYILPEGGIEADLSQNVKDSLAKADSALQETDIANLATKNEVATAKTEAISAAKTELDGITLAIEKYNEVESIVIKDSKGAVIADVSAATFIKDGMLTNAVYNAETNKITLTWNTDAGKTDTEIDLTDLVDTYTGGNGISVSNSGEISIDDNVVVTHTDLNSTVNTLVGTVDDTADTASITGAKKYTDAAIVGLDSSVKATATVDNTVNVLTGVTQEDGKLTGKNEVTLAAIAKTGNVNDLVQTEGDVLVLFGGNAAGWTE